MGPGSIDPRSSDPSARDAFCPYFKQAIELIGKRWSGTILRSLTNGPLRFSEISARVPEISDRSLSLRLKELEAAGVIVRSVPDTRPVTVAYGLSQQGLDLEEVIAGVERWAHDWLAAGDTHASEPEQHGTERRNASASPSA